MNRTMMSIVLATGATACASNHVKQPAAVFSYQNRETTQGDTVLKAQVALNNLGFLVEKTGVIDTRTRTALLDFQQQQNLVQSGQLDAATRGKLRIDRYSDAIKQDPSDETVVAPNVKPKMIP